MKPKQNLREKVSNYFGIPIGKIDWRLYMESLNESGKITVRSLLDMIVILLEYIEEKEKS
jgi:hypothetical protein